MTKLNLRDAAWIGRTLPSDFESYCKILHPFTVFDDIPDTLIPEAQWKKPGAFHINMGTGKVTVDGKDWVPDELVQRRDKGEGASVSWKTVGKKYGVPFHDEIRIEDYAAKFKAIGWPENVLFPMEGRLSMPVLSIILDILKQYSPENKVRIYQLTPHSIRWEDEVVEGSYDEVPDYFDKRYFIGWLFPPDRSWVLYTDTDLCYTLMGGPSSLIDRLAESPLEVVGCDASTMV
jgi:hypothetical protein